MENHTKWAIIGCSSLFIGVPLFWMDDWRAMVIGAVLILISGGSARQLHEIQKVGSKMEVE